MQLTHLCLFWFGGTAVLFKSWRILCLIHAQLLSVVQVLNYSCYSVPVQTSFIKRPHIFISKTAKIASLGWRMMRTGIWVSFILKCLLLWRELLVFISSTLTPAALCLEFGLSKSFKKNWSQNIWWASRMTGFVDRSGGQSGTSVQSQDEVLLHRSINSLWSPPFCLKDCGILRLKRNNHGLHVSIYLKMLEMFVFVVLLQGELFISYWLKCCWMYTLLLTYLTFILHYFPSLSFLHHHPSHVLHDPIYKRPLKAWPVNKVSHCQWCAPPPSFQINQAH